MRCKSELLLLYLDLFPSVVGGENMHASPRVNRGEYSGIMRVQGLVNCGDGTA